jgi:hypothetical protein
MVAIRKIVHPSTTRLVPTSPNPILLGTKPDRYEVPFHRECPTIARPRADPSDFGEKEIGRSDESGGSL